MTIAVDQIEHFMAIWYVCRFFNSLFRNKRFVLNEKLQWNASKFAILLEYENTCTYVVFFSFFILCYLFFPNECPVLYVQHEVFTE